MELNELRQQIDAIDREIIELWASRMQVSAQIAEYKKENGIAMLDSAREEALLKQVRELAGEELGEYSQRLYATILEISREYQNKK